MKQQSAIALSVCILFITVIAAGCGESSTTAATQSLTVFAAAGTTAPMTEIAEVYRAGTGVQVRLNLAASSTLAKQIEAGAEADVYISADTQWMEYLDQRSLIQPGSRRDLLGNSLVLIVPADSAATVELTSGTDFGKFFAGRLSIGDPEHVPVGKYAKEALSSLGFWDQIKDRAVLAPDVKSALRFVEAGEAGAGIVYGTDAITSKKIRILAAFPENTHRKIVFSAALTVKSRKEAGAFFEFLCGDRGCEIFRRFGYRLLEE
ncbi:MAG: molybdate ABC transporter substrate-binding protein [Candidatus Wallbacteria bacterium]|nr:molybdate ABC transporter substrate-binding protein [Candidatus Wallbacteria bacterium]